MLFEPFRREQEGSMATTHPIEKGSSASIANEAKAKEMEIWFVVTGFGPFGGVEENPTTVIIRRLDSFLRCSSSDNRECGGVSMKGRSNSVEGIDTTAQKSGRNSTGRCDNENGAVHATTASGSVVLVADLVKEYVVLETSAGDVDDVIDRIRRDYIVGSIASATNHDIRKANDLETNSISCNTSERTPCSTRRRILLLHLGVGRSEGFRLESCAYNEATFRIPDQRGYQPDEKPIISDLSHDVGQCYETSLNLEDLQKRMERDMPGVVTTISTDPGRFVCNYVYCKSLEISRPYSGRSHRNQKPPAGNLVSGSSMRTMGNKLFAAGSAGTGDQNSSNEEHFSCESLFLHVPHFEHVPEEEQVAYVAALMKNLAEQGT